MPAIFDIITVLQLKPNKLEFIKEYNVIMAPLVATLDSLQGNQAHFYGMLLHRLVQLHNRLQALATGSIVHTL